jgi:hypothetical protein
MSSKIVEIKSVIRAMRGGSQSQLVEGQDGRCYVVKFRNNPQGSRILINEWFGARLFRRLSISTPSIRVLRLSQSVRDQAGLSVSKEGGKAPVEPGCHFGSECPVDPRATAIFDLLPRKLLNNVINLDDFAKALVIDTWLGNSDLRQAIFSGNADGLAVSRFGPT